MSKTKSNIHTILCDYVFLYEYRVNLVFFNDFEKNKGIQKNLSNELSLVEQVIYFRFYS